MGGIYSRIVVIGYGVVAGDVLKYVYEKSGSEGYIVEYIEHEIHSFNLAKKYAESVGIEYHVITEKNQLLLHLKRLTNQKLLIVSASNNYIFPDELISDKNVSIINFHNALLPEFPGRNAPSWVIYEGKTKTGITWHFVTRSIDAGDIIIQKECMIDDDIKACNFCYRLDKGFRPRSAESIIAEIRMLKEKYHIKYVAFSDELLMSSKERTLELCQAFIDSQIDIKWDCNGRLNYADKDVLLKMKEAGCVFINYGIESLDDETRRVMHKGLTKEMIINGVENTLEVGISPGLNIIYGNINEPLSAIDEAVEFLLKYDDHSQLRTIRPVTPYPGCELFDIAVEKGLVKDVEDFYENKHTNSDLLSVNFTQYSDEEVYEALYKANLKLINRHIDVTRERNEQLCRDLYMNHDESFRGFRQT